MASSTETQAWHMPNYAITWLNHYNIQDLIEVDLSILFQERRTTELAMQNILMMDLSMQA